MIKGSLFSAVCIFFGFGLAAFGLSGLRSSNAPLHSRNPFAIQGSAYGKLLARLSETTIDRVWHLGVEQIVPHYMSGEEENTGRNPLTNSPAEEENTRPENVPPTTVIERFEQIGIERWKIAQTLKAACAQRLIKVLCPYCKIRKPGLTEREIRKFNLDDEWRETPVFQKGVEGCGECGGRGYLGRAAILEIIPITPEWSDALSKGTLSPYELEIAVREQGLLPSLRTSGLKMVREGRTDLEALRKSIDMSVGD